MAINAPETVEFNYSPNDLNCDLLILAAGFEDRAFQFVSNAKLASETKVILISFDNDLEINDETYDNYLTELCKTVDAKNVIKVVLCQERPREYSNDLDKIIGKLSHEVNDIWVDISGMPTHAICATLKVVRDNWPKHSQNIIYTSAMEYHPNIDEYHTLQQRQSEGVEYLPASMAKEMAENLILNSFSGQRTNEGQSCLALFAGYEVHRSAGVVENVNPSILLILYGKPEGEGLDWRLDLSKQLHKKFEKTRKSAVEEVSTLQMRKALEYLDEYYEYLYDEFDLTIAPVCSKMHSVAAYLFWEKYREIQLIFPLPIGYKTEKKAVDVDETYITALEPRHSLYRETI